MARLTIATGVYTDFEMLHRSAVGLSLGSNLYRHGDEFTDGNLNAPHVAALMLPVASLSIQSAAVVAWIAIALSVAAVACLLARVLSPRWVGAALAVALASPAGYLSVRFVNLAWPVALGVTIAWLAMRGGQHRRAGALLGVLATLKIFLLIFLPYFAWRRQWRALVAAILAGSTTVAVGLLVCGIDAYVGWIEQLRSVRWHANHINVAVYGFLQRSLDGHAPGGFTALADSPVLVMPLWIAASGTMIAVMLWRFGREPHIDREWAALLVAALLISPVGWAYYWALAIGPAAVTLKQRSTTWLERAALILGLLPFFVLTYGQPSPWLTLTWASAYTWGALLLWLAILRPDTAKSRAVCAERAGQ